MTEETETPVRAYDKWQLSKLYGVGAKTFNKWIEPFTAEIGKQRGKKYTPAQVKIIFTKLGTP